jgi:hypothetical protein
MDALDMFLEDDERLAYHTAMDQWERSLKRPDLSEKDRVRGALFAFSRQMLACRIIEQMPPLLDSERL